MLELRRHRHLILVCALFVSTAGCEIQSRLGSAPPDAGTSDRDASSLDGGAKEADGASDRAGIVDAGPLADVVAPPTDALDGGGTDGNVPPTDAGTDQIVVFACLPNSAPRVPVVPLRRLTNFEYNNTVRYILADTSRPADGLPFDGYPNNADTPSLPMADFINGYHQLAHAFAVGATKDAVSLKALIKCDVAVDGEAGCQKKFVEPFVSSIFRRPLDTADTADFAAVFAKGRELSGDFAGGVRAVVEVALQSPEFLYRVEFGKPVAANQPVRPTSFEMASRLSYLLWGSSPDSALWDAATQDQLQTKEQIAAQARRMLGDDRAREVVKYFYLQLLGLNVPSFMTLSFEPATFPTFTSDMPSLLLQETSAFIDEATWQGAGDLQTVLTAPFTFMNASLARLYGVSGISGDSLQKVAVDSKKRAGILTQGSVLASTSSSTRESPTRRGKLVFERILCRTLQPPPSAVVPPLPDGTGLTTRGRYEQIQSQSPQCKDCHKEMDPLGFAFEHFDAAGRWRDTEGGQAIDATGELLQTDAKGKFDGAVDLMARLAQSHDVQNCYVGNWMSFGYGRVPAPEDACSTQSLQDAFAQAKGNVRELLVALTQTDAFLYKSAP